MLGFRAVYFSIRKPTEDERHGARPPAVRMATFACGGVRGSCARAGAVWGARGAGSAAAASAGLGVPGHRVAAAVFCRARNAKHRALFARFERQGPQRPAAATKNVQRDGGTALPSPAARRSAGFHMIWQASDTVHIGNRKQRACQRRLVRVGSPVSAACDIHTWLRQRF